MNYSLLRKAIGCMISVLIITGLFCSCGEQDNSPIIAQVGNSALTLEGLYESIPREYRGSITREQNMQYAKQWIDNELLFQEALRRKLHREALIKKRIEKMRRDLLCAEMISRNTMSNSIGNIGDGAIETYYQENKSQFIRDEDVVKYLEIIVEDVKTAWQVRSQLTQSNFFELATRHSLIPVVDPRSLNFVPVTRLHPSVAEALATLKVNRINGPVKTDAGYSIIKLLAREEEGSTASLEEVKDDIASRILMKRQKDELAKLLDNLRQNTYCEFNFDAIPGAKTKRPVHAPAERDSVDTVYLNES
ncbi:MAG: hypothetical protein GF398_14205 [Chitinivibrionales bacterium]|nr:hypothetical protein [Chitinivibrionales bacterium]